MIKKYQITQLCRKYIVKLPIFKELQKSQKRYGSKKFGHFYISDTKNFERFGHAVIQNQKHPKFLVINEPLLRQLIYGAY